MGRRRNIKRRLPSIEVVTFEGSSRRTSKRRIVLKTPAVVRAEKSDSKDKVCAKDPPMQPFILDDSYVNDGRDRGDDEDKSEGQESHAEVSHDRKH